MSPLELIREVRKGLITNWAEQSRPTPNFLLLEWESKLAEADRLRKALDA